VSEEWFEKVEERKIGRAVAEMKDRRKAAIIEIVGRAKKTVGRSPKLRFVGKAGCYSFAKGNIEERGQGTGEKR